MLTSKLKFSRNLSENAFSRYFSFSALYVAQGIPEGITYFAIPAWLAANGKTPMEIASFLGIIGIPWSFKIIIAPLMDRFTILSMGRKRPWIITGQLGLILSFLCIGLVPDPLNNSFGLMAAGFFISFFGAFQDVATDGMAVDVIPVDEQARANGLMWGTKIAGTSLSLVIGTALINTFGFSAAISSLAIAVAIIMLVPLYVRERPGEKFMPWSKGKASITAKKTQLRSWKQIFKSLYRVVKLKSSLIFIIAMFINGLMLGLVDTLMPIFSVQELGWTNSNFSNVFSIATLSSGILGMFLGGYLVDYFGKIKMITIYLVLTTALIVLFAFLSGLWSNLLVMYGFIFIYYTLSTFLTIAVFASGMHLCWKTVAATQFTLFMAVSNMGRASGSAMLGYLKTYFNWDIVFLITAISPFLMLIIVKFIHFERHRVKVDSFNIPDKEFSLPSMMRDI